MHIDKYLVSYLHALTDFSSQPTQNPTTLKPTTLKPSTALVRPPLTGECADTVNYQDIYGGTCAEYESNAAWCGGYGTTGEPGKTPNENCCVCIAKLSGSGEEEIVLGGIRGRRLQSTTSGAPQIGDQRVSFSETSIHNHNRWCSTR